MDNNKLITKITNPNKFCLKLFLQTPSTLSLFITHSKNPAIIGKRIPFAICANLIIVMGLILSDENNTPKTKIKIQTALNFLERKFVFHPKQPLAT